MAAEGNSMDVLFMDPPRAGSDEKIYGICSEDGTGEDRVHFLQSGDTGKRFEVSDKKRISGKKDTAGGNVCVYGTR